MPNKFYTDYNAPPKGAILPPPKPGTKGVSQPTATFTPVTSEPKKGL